MASCRATLAASACAARHQQLKPSRCLSASRTTQTIKASRPAKAHRTVCCSLDGREGGAAEGSYDDRTEALRQAFERSWQSEWQSAAHHCSTGYQTDSEDDLPPLLEDEHYDPADDIYTPFPSKPEDFPEYDQIPDLPPTWATLNNLGTSPSASQTSWGDLSQVFVILFGVGETETEGIYSLRAMLEEDGMFRDTIIAFQHEEEAERYAGLLEATMMHTPHICPIDPSELLDFCIESGYSCRLETTGSVLIPPTHNVGLTDWERSIRLRDGQYSVLDMEPLPADASSQWAEELEQLTESLFHNNIGGAGPLSSGYFADDELEEMRLRLERLLPQSPEQQ